MSTPKDKIVEIICKGQARFRQVMERPGSKQLWDYLTESDFFTAPASTYHHAAFTGGLAVHSWQVYLNFQALILKYGNKTLSPESQFLIAYLHDICKVQYYSTSWRWYKDEVETGGKWEKWKQWVVDDKIPLGHGERSVYLLQRLIQINPEEACGIRHHLGFADRGAGPWPSAINEAFSMYPTSVLVFLADFETAVTEEENRFWFEGQWYDVPREDKFEILELMALTKHEYKE